MEKNAAAGRTPSSLPMSTPPPASLNISSPDFAPLSPVNANPLGDAKLNMKPEPTSFNLPPSYNEENRAFNTISSRPLGSDYASGDQRNERFMTGGMVVLLCLFCSLILNLKAKYANWENSHELCSYHWNIGCN